MAQTRRIVELAAIIHSGTVKIDQYLESKDIVSPSVELDAPVAFDLPDSIATSRNAVLDATDELHALLLGPIQFLTSISSSLPVTIQAMYRFKIASAFGVGQSATFAEIAQTVGLNEEDTRRLLRAAMTHRIFREPRKGVVEHTAISKLIAETPLLQQYLGLASEESWLATSRLVDASIKWPGSAESDETGYNIATNSVTPYFQDIKDDPMRAKRFDDTMTFAHASGGFERALLLETYDWGAFTPGLVVDVGGSRAQMSIDLVRKFPGLRAINQDLPDVIAAVQIPKDVKDRVELQVHDFFTEQPVKGADVYLFRWIFHDWADSYSIKTIRNILPALKKGARIVVGDICLPEHNTLPLFAERRLRGFDLHMKAVLNGKERDAEDWTKLFAAVDPRLHFNGVKQHPKSRWATIEAVWQGESYIVQSEL